VAGVGVRIKVEELRRRENEGMEQKEVKSGKERKGKPRTHRSFAQVIAYD